MEALKRVFVTNAKAGRLWSYRELRAYARNKRLSVDYKELSRIRKNWLETAIYQRAARLRPSVFQSHSIPQFGLVQVDIAFYLGQEKSKNDNYIGFLVCASPSTGLLHAVLVKDKATASLERAVLELVRDSIVNKYACLH